jgi:hypothetical protein
VPRTDSSRDSPNTIPSSSSLGLYYNPELHIPHQPHGELGRNPHQQIHSQLRSNPYQPHCELEKWSKFTRMLQRCYDISLFKGLVGR